MGPRRPHAESGHQRWSSPSYAGSPAHCSARSNRQWVPAITVKDLLIDIMLRAGLNTGRLHAENGLICSNAGQERVRAEALPVASALSYTSDVHHWTKSDTDTFADMFFTHRNTAATE